MQNHRYWSLQTKTHGLFRCECVSCPQVGSRAGSSWRTESSLTTTARTTWAKEAKAPSRCPCVTLKVRALFETLGRPRLALQRGSAQTDRLCFVPVHPTDPTRLELIIPGEQHFYVRAVNAAERQRWLVALGSSKAGTLDSHKHKGTELTCRSLPLGSLHISSVISPVIFIQSQKGYWNRIWWIVSRDWTCCSFWKMFFTSSEWTSFLDKITYSESIWHDLQHLR